MPTKKGKKAKKALKTPKKLQATKALAVDAYMNFQGYEK